MVVITTTGAAVAMPWLDQVRAVLHGWFPGQEAGAAFADVLFGDVSPSGKLPVTFPKRLQDEPGFGNFPGSRRQSRLRGREPGRLSLVRHAQDRAALPVRLRAFLHQLRLPRPGGFRLGSHAGRSVRLKVKNIGVRRGAEVVQIYVHATAGAARPEQELRAFAKVDLAPGEEREVTLKLPVRAFAYFAPMAPSTKAGKSTPAPTRVRAASSSRDIRLRAP